MQVRDNTAKVEVQGLFETLYGHFSLDGSEYVVTKPDTPRPWVNVISNGDYGLVVSQVGGGFSWRTHSNYNRITRWNQDLLRDEWGKYLFLRDEENGAFWPCSGQALEPENYRCRHGLGYSVFEMSRDGIESKQTVFVAADDPLEIWILHLRNTSDRPRSLSATSYFEWNLGAAPDNHREFHTLFIETEFRDAILATKRLWEVPTELGHWNTDWPYCAFHGCSEEIEGFDCDKASFVGRHRDFSHPKGMEQPQLAGNSGKWTEATASLRSRITLAPGEEKSIVFTLGAADGKDSALALNEKFASVEAAEKELERVIAGWKERLGKVWVETPDKAFDILNNLWLKYQAISGHLWGRAAFYQQSGAFGFRDQLQTSQIWLPLEPSQMRRQIVLHARHQLQAGTVLHWWHPLLEEGLKTNMTDDLLWLPYMITAYLKETVDWGLLSETVPFYDGSEAPIFEHCRRAIAVVLGRFSERGLPLIGEGDWCDGFSSVGLAWKGESVWLGHFLYRILLDWADILERRGVEPELAKQYLARAESLKKALNEIAWMGDRFFCATTDQREIMGAATCLDNQIYLNSQTWAVIGGSASPGRAGEAMATAHRLLEGDNGMQLFWPAYRTVDRNIGYITRYTPGARENGGVYTHAATWGILADAMLKKPNDAYRLYQKLNPIVSSGKDADRYCAEPYVLPGNIDGVDSPHYGRAGWTWYTGAAGWLSSIGLQWILGLQPTYEGLRLNPCFPEEWEGVRVKRIFRGCRYDIEILRDSEKSGVISVDGKVIDGDILPLFTDEAHHGVTMFL